MKFGVLFVPGTEHGSPERYSDIFDQVRAAEELGFDSVWFTEHHFSEYGRPLPNMMAAHAAAITERIAVGSAVVILPLHDPIEVAEEVATLCHLSGGRYQFGIGRGNQPEEFAAFGVSLDDAKDRFDESFEIITGLLTQERFSYDGKFWQIPESTLVPRLPDGTLPPIWQPAVSEPSVRWVISKGINGMIGPYLTPYEVLDEKFFSPWNRFVAEAGADVRMAHNQLVHVAPTDKLAYEEAKEAALWYARLAARLWGLRDRDKASPSYRYMAEVVDFLQGVSFDEIFEMSVIGSPKRVAEQIGKLESYGVDKLLVFNWFGPTMTNEKVLGSLRLLAEEVMPQFRSAPVVATPA